MRVKCSAYLVLGLHLTTSREIRFLLCTNFMTVNREEVGAEKEIGHFLLTLSTRNTLHLFTIWPDECLIKQTYKETKFAHMELNYSSLVANDSSRLELNCDFLPQKPLFISRHQSIQYFWIKAGGVFEKRRQTQYRNEELFVSLRVIV